MEKRYYLAYGSNLNVKQMTFRCPESRMVGLAQIKDYRLLFKGSKTGSYLTIEPMKGSTVPVVVWEVSERDEYNLDRYEGYPNFYYKAEMEIEFKGIRTDRIRKRDAFVYIMHEERKCGLPSGSYLHTCLEGYRNFGFDRNFLIKAMRDSELLASDERGNEE